jgi:hypothetical protein
VAYASSVKNKQERFGWDIQAQFNTFFENSFWGLIIAIEI